jgi:type III restriction enzyme
MPRSAVEVGAREQVICVVTDTKDQVSEKFENVEEVNPDSPGGKVEYIFSVQMLTEGWDVDNVFQIVPMEEKAFNSKLLISQILGRGLRIPREIRQIDIEQAYPILTVTNHESFSKHIEELLNQVTQSELRFTSSVIEDPDLKRYNHHFNLFNLRYVPNNRTVDKEEVEQQTSLPKQLDLEKQEENLKVRVHFEKGKRDFKLSKDFFTVDQVISEINQRFKSHVFEREHFDFGDGIELDSIPQWEDIEKVITSAMQRAGISGNKLTEVNRNLINLFFNQYLPKGNKKVIRENIEGNIFGISSNSMPKTSISAGGLDNFTSIFVSEEYKNELTGENLATIDELQKAVEENRQKQSEEQIGLFDKQYEYKEEYIRQLIVRKNMFAVNQSMFKTPQDMVIVTHQPERQFVFRLIENSKLIDSWIKSPDKGFYSLDYTFWKGGKDRTVRSFNPDFFIKISLEEYINQVSDDVNSLKSLQEKGMKEIILVVEIKGDIEMDKERVVNAKNSAGIEHFDTLTKRLEKENPINFESEFRNSTRQYYKFFLLHPHEYQSWFRKLNNGNWDFRLNSTSA